MSNESAAMPISYCRCGRSGGWPGPVVVSRLGHKLVVLVSAEEWQRLEELESAEATAWWRRDAAERANSDEEPGEGEEGPGLDEAEFRRRFAHLFHDVGAA